MKVRYIVSFFLLFVTQYLFSQQLFPENFPTITKGAKKMTYSIKGIESENWRTEGITYYDNKGNKTKEEQYKYDSEFTNGFHIVPTNYTYKKGKLFCTELIEYTSSMRNDLYYFDTLKKVPYRTYYFYNPSGALERIEKNKDSVSTANPWSEDGVCTSTYMYKNNLLIQVDSICDMGGGCKGYRRLIAYNDKKQVSSITLISDIVNNQCEPTSYIAPNKFTEFIYNDKRQIIKEKIKNVNIYSSENDSMTYNYFYTGIRLDSIRIVLKPEEYHTCIGSIIYTYDQNQRITRISVFQIGERKDDELKFEFVY